jgi:hypothetical protein
MDDSSIAGHTGKLRREIELIQHEERLYRSQMHHSLADRAAHVKREFRSSRSEKNLERLSKKRSNDQATDQAGTVVQLTSTQRKANKVT